MTPRREFTKEHRREMLRRALRGNAVRCEGCGLDLTGKAFEFDHVRPEALVVDRRRPLTADDGQLLGRDCCHRSPDGKTARDMEAITKARRQEADHHRLDRPKMRSAGFRKAPPRRTASRPLCRHDGGIV